MEEYETVDGAHFGNEAVSADGREFIDCTFDGTTLVFSGISTFIVSGGAGRPKVAFVGHAETTLMQLATMHRFGFAGIVEKLFDKVRDTFGDKMAQ